MEEEEPKKKNDNIKNSKEDVKQYLEGELHKEIQKNQIDSKIKEKNIIHITQQVTSQRNIFIKDKLSKMSVNKNISQGINKSMDKQIKNLETDIIRNKILMTKTPTNSKKKY